MGGFAYLLASKRNGTLYTGVAADLIERVWQHKNKITKGFTAKYGVDKLVWYAQFDRIEDAIAEEKRIKNWRRAWKIALIEKINPQWRDLYDDLNK
jgi:putative endonuclease